MKGDLVPIMQRFRRGDRRMEEGGVVWDMTEGTYELLLFNEDFKGIVHVIIDAPGNACQHTLVMDSAAGIDPMG
jgi:hypothetical protein